MPYVCTGNLGKRYEWGQAVPEALTWPPSMVAMHERAGTIRNVSVEDAAKMEATWKARRADAKARQLDRDLIAANNLVSAARSNVKHLEAQLATAKAHLAGAESNAATVAEQLAAAKRDVPIEAMNPPIQKPAPIRKDPPPAAPPPPSDEQVRKLIFVEVSHFGRGALIKFASAKARENAPDGKLIGSGWGIEISPELAKASKETIRAFVIEERLKQLKPAPAATKTAQE